MTYEAVLESELERLVLLGETILAVLVSIAAYLAAKLRFGWWPRRRPRV